MIAVTNSSNVASVGWTFVFEDDGRRFGDLYISFKGGGEYVYHKVPQDRFVELIGAPSAGKYLNQQIKPNHVFGKIVNGKEVKDEGAGNR